MFKLISLVALLVFTAPSFAHDCATDFQSFKALVGNSGLAKNWKETSTGNPYILKIRDSSEGKLLLRVESSKGEIATATAMICRRGENFSARILDLDWGPAAPGIAKATSFKEIKIRFIYQSLMKVSISFFGFEYAALD